MIASPRLAKSKKSVCLLRFEKEREENLQLKVQKIEQEATKKKKNISYLIVGTITAIGIVITYLLLQK
jgi:hypothetical protein